MVEVGVSEVPEQLHELDAGVAGPRAEQPPGQLYPDHGVLRGVEDEDGQVEVGQQRVGGEVNLGPRPQQPREQRPGQQQPPRPRPAVLVYLVSDLNITNSSFAT